MFYRFDTTASPRAVSPLHRWLCPSLGSLSPSLVRTVIVASLLICLCPVVHPLKPLSVHCHNIYEVANELGKQLRTRQICLPGGASLLVSRTDSQPRHLSVTSGWRTPGAECVKRGDLTEAYGSGRSFPVKENFSCTLKNV